MSCAAASFPRFDFSQCPSQAACRPASRTSPLLSLAPKSGKRAFRSSSVVRASIHEVGILLAAAAEEAAEAVKPGDVQGGSGMTHCHHSDTLTLKGGY